MPLWVLPATRSDPALRELRRRSIRGDMTPDEAIAAGIAAARFYNQATTRTDRLASVLSKAINGVGRPVEPSPTSASAVHLAERKRRFPELFVEPPGGRAQSGNGLELR
jgi:hypothetical protein